jgi:hypothetical protein
MRSREPMLPTSTGVEWMPMRTRSGSCPRPAIARSALHAALDAQRRHAGRKAWSSSSAGAPQKAITPSPMNLSIGAVLPG